MLDATLRRKMIMEKLEAEGNIRVSQLAEACGTSDMTIRRDLAKLEDTGYLRINRGLVSLNTGSSVEVSSSVKAHRATEQKKRIAKAAAAQIQPGSSVYLDCGATVKELAMELANIKKLTVYTNSLLACNVLCNYPNVELHVLPGRFSEVSMGALDTTTLQMLQHLRFDVAVLGAEAVDPRVGFMVPEEDDCSCKQIVMDNSQKTLVLADSSKIFQTSRCIYAQPREVDLLITDSRCSSEAKKQFAQAELQLLTV